VPGAQGLDGHFDQFHRWVETGKPTARFITSYCPVSCAMLLMGILDGPGGRQGIAVPAVEAVLILNHHLFKHFW
jgi:hypothetical protein